MPRRLGKQAILAQALCLWFSVGISHSVPSSLLELGFCQISHFTSCLTLISSSQAQLLAVSDLTSGTHGVIYRGAIASQSLQYAGLEAREMSHVCHFNWAK